MEEYDVRYLQGIEFFNNRDFFEAHEVWEEIWLDGPADQRRFYQGLIQAAVALYHGSSGNWRGTQRLFQSGRAYMLAYPPVYLGLDIPRFWQQMERALADLLQGQPTPERAVLDDSQVPTIQLETTPVREA